MMRPLHRCIGIRGLFGLGLSVSVFVSMAAAVATAATAAGRPRPLPLPLPMGTTREAVVTLMSGVAVERAIGAGEEQTFQILVAQGEALRVAVDQEGADVSLVIQFGSEAPVIINDESKHRYGRELGIWQTPDRGNVRLIVRDVPSGTRETSSPARYRLSVTIVPPSEALASAMTTSGEARRLSQAPAANAEAAVQALRAAVEAWRAFGDRDLLAQSLLQLGRFQTRSLRRPADCVVSLTEALGIYETLARPVEIAATLVEIGDAQLLIGARAEGRATYERAYTHGDAIDPLDRAIIEDDLAKASTSAGDFDRGVMFGQRAIDTFHAAGARRDEFLALENLAQTYQRMRRFDDALRTATEAIALAREHGRVDDLPTVMRTLGMIHLASGDDETALVTLRRALDLFEGQPPSRLATMLSIGRLYNRMGEAAQAREWLEKTLAAVPPQLREYWAAAASELGSSLTLSGEPARALDLQRKAVEVAAGRSTIGEMSMLPGLAATCRALGDLECARKATARVGELALTFPGNPYASIVWRERARDAEAAGDLAAARQHLDAALEVMESERGRLHTEALRASFGGLTVAYYDDAIELAMQMHAASPRDGHDVRAFELFERSRARSLSDLLVEARSDIKSGVDPALLAEQRSLQSQLGRKDSALRDLAGKPAAREQAPVIEREIDDITRQLSVLDARIRETSPRYAALTRPAPLSAPEIQRLLDDETVLLAFSAGPSRPRPAMGAGAGGWGWALTRDTVRSFPLPASGQVEEAARKVYEGLAARQRYVASDGPARLAQIDRDLAVDAAALSDLVLGPIADALHGAWRTRRLAIVATGALEYVPFAALPVPALPKPIAATVPRDWLVATHELVQLPSASVLARLREDESRRVPASRALAVLADAVYGADDPRVHEVARATVTATAITASAGDQRVFSGLAHEDRVKSRFQRLVFSREEATAISKLAAGSGVLEALDFDASLATITSPALADARIVHIASHGILNSARPELSGLVLSLVDPSGRPQEGVLRLYDVFNLKLAADLVVLSGCQTGLGRHMKSEGFVGLARAFMYAGAPRVVASLWQVDDLATAELMRRFYHGMLVRKLSAAAALRAAQDEMRTSDRWRAPYYWAAFTLMGDWR